MVCRYCTANNDEDNHRCNRCGRRLGDTIPVQYAAAVPVLQPDIPIVEKPGPQLVTELAKASERADYAVQASLFGPQEVTKNVPPSRRPAVHATRPKHDRSVQKALDFTTAVEPVQAVVYGDAPVAMAIHRAVAAALDIAIVMMAIGVFLATFHFAGHEILLTKQTLPVYTAVAVIISLFYRVLFCIANTDTLGVHWSGLRLLNFDGRLPSRRERFCRTAGACISVIAVGVGFLWALVDEERLTWHDYISKTFPSPRNAG